MNRVNFIALGVVAVVAFVASSLWYSPLLFGRQFVELSGVAGSPQPNAVKALSEWKAALGVGLWLWVGFPVVLLTGSMLWQNVPWQLAAIHSGDWLIKLVLIPLAIALWPKQKLKSIASVLSQ